jgi:hypothetical protein
MARTQASLFSAKQNHHHQVTTMSDLTALQPSIFFASCALKGVVWLPWYFLPELIHKPEFPGDDLILEDHLLLTMERICHWTNIFMLVGLVMFYAVNPRLWQYRNYGWLLTALLLLQHIPQLVIHEQWPTRLLRAMSSSSATASHSIMEDDDVVADSAIAMVTTSQLLQTNRIFSTIGVILVQVYGLYYGDFSTLQRLAAEPFFVYMAIITLLLETHVTCLAVWMGSTDHHISVSVAYSTRLGLCAALGCLLLAAVWFHCLVHKDQVMILRKQLKTVGKAPKIKSV